MAIDEVMDHLSLRMERRKGIGILMDEEDVHLLYRVAREAPDDGWVVELGTCRGGSTAVLCSAVGGNRVATIDDYLPKRHRHRISKSATERRMAELGFHPLVAQGDCLDVPEGVDRVAFLFVDCWHTGEGFRAQMGVWGPLLVPGAIVACHDYDRADGRYENLTAAIDSLIDAAGFEVIERGVMTLVFRVGEWSEGIEF